MEYKIGLKIKEFRSELKITQKELAKLVNKSPTAVASWEQCLSEPCVNDIRQLCIIFDVSADELLGL
ncbi:MAG: helix-turn-helix transcriptional regulator [Clostridia bacterium]|nr:helix-turn-helix transcriptional regulator [Clostridia bacterium]